MRDLLYVRCEKILRRRFERLHATKRISKWSQNVHEQAGQKNRGLMKLMAVSSEVRE